MQRSTDPSTHMHPSISPWLGGAVVTLLVLGVAAVMKVSLFSGSHIGSLKSISASHRATNSPTGGSRIEGYASIYGNNRALGHRATNSPIGGRGKPDSDTLTIHIWYSLLGGMV